jgi:two-component system chemotaxis response regulator CheB
VAGGIYVAPGGRHLRLDKVDGQPRLLIEDSPPVKFCRPSVDVLFNDAAHVFGASALGVILTGMGSDGLDGARRLRTAGARIVAQYQASSVVWGMPGSVVREGLANCVLPIQSMGGFITAALQAGARS